MNGTPNDPRIRTYSNLATKLIEIKTQLANGWTLDFSLSDSGIIDLVDLIIAGDVTTEGVLTEVMTFANDVTRTADVFGLPVSGDRFVTKFEDYFIIMGRRFCPNDQTIVIEFDYDENLSSDEDDEEEDDYTTAS
ncbi:hypothetical protein [Spirosoma arcticum]